MALAERTFLFLLVVIPVVVNSISKDFEWRWEKVELPLGPKTDWYESKGLRVKKFNRTTYALECEVYLLREWNETIDITFELMYSSMGNNQYTKIPLDIKNMNYCQFMERYYRGWGMKELKPCSNMPQVEPGEKLCPVAPKLYFIKNFVFNQERLPSVMRPGTWKAEILLKKIADQDPILRMTVVCVLTKFKPN